MGGDHHGCKPPYLIPNYTTYQVEGCTKLEGLQKALAAKGLKDPWIRNEVWRYSKDLGTIPQRARTFFFRGFVWGLAGTIVVVGAQKMLGGGGHDHHEHGEGHH